MLLKKQIKFLFDLHGDSDAFVLPLRKCDFASFIVVFIEAKQCYWVLLLATATFFSSCSKDEQETNPQLSFPHFGPEIEVTINGLNSDAMEPFISPDGTTLFFNNLNDGINTKLYYASFVNDSVFNFTGELSGTNQDQPPHLDAVPDMDSDGNFYWTSTRDYPNRLDNLFHGEYTDGSVKNTGRLQGDFYKDIPGWLVMDHGVSANGEFLYFNNARFDSQNCQGPCETELGIARKVNDSTFMTIPESSAILQNISNPDYIYYAPAISSDNLELYFTRFLKGPVTTETQVEICVAIRKAATDNFSPPQVLFSDFISDIIEAPTLTSDKRVIYYHRKSAGIHKIVMRYRSD